MFRPERQLIVVKIAVAQTVVAIEAWRAASGTEGRQLHHHFPGAIDCVFFAQRRRLRKAHRQLLTGVAEEIDMQAFC